jgi:hypothetical protein
MMQALSNHFSSRFMLCVLFLWVSFGVITPGYAALIGTNPPSLSATKSGSIVDLRWSMDCSITAANIQESTNGTAWTTVYTGLGNPDDNSSMMMSFASFIVRPTGPLICSGDWTSSRYLNLTNKTQSGYYYRINACKSTDCGEYGSSLVVGSPASGGGTSGGSLTDISQIPDGYNRTVSPAENELVGEIAAQAGVDGGAFSYSVPLTVAPGRKGMQPSLSLNYSSQSGEGLVGIGWSLSANSSIARCGKIFDLDATSVSATYSSDDKLCFNGSRLLAVTAPSGSTKGPYGAVGTYYQTERNPDMYIQQLGGVINSTQAYFKITEPNGTEHYLGDDVNSRIVLAGLSVPSTWLQRLTRDLNGNEVAYVYDASVAGDRYLQAIFYTGHKGIPGTRHIRFDYTTIPAKKAYHWGGYAISNKRLTGISMNIGGIDRAFWRLNFATPEINALNNAARLESLDYCDGQQASDCLQTRFDWFERQYSHNIETQHPLASIHDNFTVGLRPRREQDYDGDGVPDLSIPSDGIYLSRTGNKIEKRNLPGISVEEWIGDINGDRIPNVNEVSTNKVNGNLDFDLDGADDFIYTNSATELLITSLHPNGAIKKTVNTGIKATCYASILSGLGDTFCSSHAIDFNGDGQSDLLVATNNQAGGGNFTITYQAYLRKGTGFVHKGSFTAMAG